LFLTNDQLLQNMIRIAFLLLLGSCLFSCNLKTPDQKVKEEFDKINKELDSMNRQMVAEDKQKADSVCAVMNGKWLLESAEHYDAASANIKLKDGCEVWINCDAHHISFYKGKDTFYQSEKMEPNFSGFEIAVNDTARITYAVYKVDPSTITVMELGPDPGKSVFLTLNRLK
jgi:hypothetical protein